MSRFLRQREGSLIARLTHVSINRTTIRRKPGSALCDALCAFGIIAFFVGLYFMFGDTP